jgi:hypothetical protein
MRVGSSNNNKNGTCMQHIIHLTYFNPNLNVGLSSWREVYGLNPIQQLRPEVYRGKLVYRAKGSKQRISYEQVKKGLVKRSLRVIEQVPDWFR